jgi:CelD/BcsL family acetyltransferase involved in cellulose biosynthesis
MPQAVVGVEELQERLSELSRAIGRAKRAGEDPSELIAQRKLLQERLELVEPEKPSPARNQAPVVEVISDPVELEALRPQYDDLLERSSAVSPFLLLEWLLPWYRHYGRKLDLHAAVVKSGERLLAAAPLTVERTGGWLRHEVVRFLGTGRGLRGNYFNLILDPAEPAGADLLLEHLTGLLEDRRVLHLEHLSPYSDGRETLALLLRDSGREAVVQAEHGCVSGPLPGSFAEFVKNVPAPARRSHLRAGDHNVCQHFGGADYDLCTRDDQVEEFLDNVGYLNTMRKRRIGMTSSWDDERNYACRAEIAQGMLQRGALRLERVGCGGNVMAGLIGFVFKNRYFCYNIGFNQNYAHYEPGHLLLARRIRDCIAEGLAEFDFLVGDVPYKKQYFRDSIPELQVTALPPRGQGRVAHTAYMFARSLKRWR